MQWFGEPILMRHVISRIYLAVDDAADARAERRDAAPRERREP